MSTGEIEIFNILRDETGGLDFKYKGQLVNPNDFSKCFRVSAWYCNFMETVLVFSCQRKSFTLYGVDSYYVFFSYPSLESLREETSLRSRMKS